MKIVQINCVYGEGSTGKIIRDIHRFLLKKGHDAHVLYPCAHADWKEAGLHTFSNRYLCKMSAIYERAFGQKYDGAFIQTAGLIAQLEKLAPDVVHLHCINGYDINIFSLLNWLAKKRIPTVFTLHAEFPYTGNCGHAYECEKWKTGCGHCPNLKEATRTLLFDTTAQTWRKFQKSYDRFEKDKLVFTAVSPWLAKRAVHSPLISQFPVITVLNGIDTCVYQYQPDSDLRQKWGISEQEKVIFHATAEFAPNTDRLKGSRYVVEVANRLRDRGIKVIVAANYAEPSDLPDNMIYVGRITTPQEMAAYYSMADLTLIASKRETFSMVTAESLCCGTPVVGFYAGGPESIAIDAYSDFVPYGDVDALVNVSAKRLFDVCLDKTSISTEASSTYSSNRSNEAYLQIYHSLT